MKEFFLSWIFPIASGITAGALIWGLVSYVGMILRARRLKNSYEKLLSSGKPIIGQSYETIRIVCGLPLSVSPVGNGIKLCRWQDGSFGFSLLFDESETCIGLCDVTH